jgi:hypothetical protein
LITQTGWTLDYIFNLDIDTFNWTFKCFNELSALQQGSKINSKAGETPQGDVSIAEFNKNLKKKPKKP